MRTVEWTRPIQISGVWLRGGDDRITVLVEIGGRWIEVIDEYVPTHGNDGHVWPISHIVETGGIETAAAEGRVAEAEQ